MTSSNAAIETSATVRLQGVLQEVCVPAGGEADQVHLQQQAVRMERQQAAGQQEVARAIEALEAAGRQFADMQTEFFRAAEEQLLDLAVEIARKILAQEIDAERYRIDPIVTEALTGVSSCRDVVVRLNPADLARCDCAGRSAERDGHEGQEEEKTRGVRFVADAAVGRAECVIETAQGVVTSSVEHQLAEIGQALKNPE